ncbi:MAG: OmcA/MtrC family decaheme c-type cytochrome, partial [Myxococcales bacterium]|nr:OmcA/MtrC family decaheme c-type cytochrome [Myxococcales bacterium]
MSTIRRLSMASAFLALAALGACTGSNGENGLVSISSEPAGANCANGGTKVSAGLDSNGNGVLDADEVDSTDYICNGDTGTGVGALVETSTEPPGANCPDGGVKIEVGLDANGNGVLDTDEINTDATTYACNGTGTDGLVQTSPEPAGANCVDGGIRVDVGLDTNGNGDLDPSEITETSYVCDGAGGVVGPSGIASVTSGIHVGVVDVTTDVAGPVSIHFTLKDDRGYPIDINGVYSVNTAITPRFMMAYTESDANGNVLPFVVLTKSNSSSNPTAQPTSYSPIASTPVGTLVENGYRAGDYTYTFPTTDLNPGAKAVAYDPTKMDNTHVIWIDAARQTDLDNTSAAKTFYATNQAYWYVPSGNGTAVVRELVKSENCASCHRGFKPEGTTSGSFHGGRRIDPKMCNICHNPARVSNPAADSDVFVHRLHNSQALQPANLFHGIEFGFPRDIRNCDTCHKDALQGAQATAQSRISQQACGSCHDYVSFTTSAPILCTDPVTLDATTGLPLPCNHAGGPADDPTCGLGCHAQLATQHKQVAPLGSGWIAATGYMPAGAKAVSYVISSVDLVDDAAITPNKRPQITFKFQQDGVDVPFQDPGSATELWANYTGSPRVYFAFAVPQDGIETPADFNGTASGTVKDIWAGTATGSSAGTITGPDASGFYTITLTGVQLPPETSMLTGGVGYSGGMVQMNVSGYATGLTIPARATWKTGTGMTARRPIVDTAKCENCHAPLGVSPTFHSGARNDGPTCSFCHTPNRTSSGWSAASRAFVHGIHGARAREVAYNWHASSADEGFWDIEFPGPINDCTACHLDNTYNFRATATNNVLQNMQPSTVGQGTYNPSISLSPYVATDGTNYGTGFSFSTTTGLSTEASPT